MNQTTALLVITFALESALFGAALLWGQARRIDLPGLPGASEALHGCALALPLLATILVLSESPAREWLPGQRQFTRFREEVVLPLVHALPQWSFPLVSLLAGVGEEFFFRGVLLPESGMLLSSALFAVLHFGRATVEFPAVVALYFAVGLFFAFVAIHFSLWTAVFAHAFYDLLLLFFLKHQRS